VPLEETGYCDGCEQNLPISLFPSYDPDSMNICFECADETGEEVIDEGEDENLGDFGDDFVYSDEEEFDPEEEDEE